MEYYKKLSKSEIKELVKDVHPLIYISDKIFREKFKQIYHVPQHEKKKNGIYLPYLISSFGRVFSIKPDGSLYERKVPIDSNGYKLVVLNYHGKVFGVRVHRLVAQAFIKNRNKKTR